MQEHLQRSVAGAGREKVELVAFAVPVGQVQLAVAGRAQPFAAALPVGLNIHVLGNRGAGVVLGFEIRIDDQRFNPYSRQAPFEQGR